MRRSINFKILISWLALVLAGVVVARIFLDAGWGISLAVASLTLLAIFFNGLLATWEDEQPGGFHNPTPDQTDEDSTDG